MVKTGTLIPRKPRSVSTATRRRVVKRHRDIYQAALKCITHLLQLDPEQIGKVESIHIIMDEVKELMQCESVQILEVIENKPPSITVLKYFEESRQTDKVTTSSGLNHYCIRNKRFFFAEILDHKNRIAHGISGAVDGSGALKEEDLQYVMMKPDKDEESVLFYPLIKNDSGIGTIKLCYFHERKKFESTNIDFFRPVAESIANLLHLYAIIGTLNKQNLEFDTLLAEANEALEKLQIGERLTYQFLTATSHLHELAGILGGMNADREEFLTALYHSTISRKDKEDLVSIINRYTRHREEAHKKVRELLQGRPAKEKLFLKPNNIKDLINQQLEVYEDQLEQAQIRIRKSLKDADAYLNVDASAFKYLLRILLNNAMTALEEGHSRPKMLEVRATLNSTSLSIRIIDNGVGIERKDQQKIFDAFFTTRTDGSGIGLYWAKKTVEDDHGGRLILERSLPQQGASFLITLPMEKR